ncbi:MAG: polysaccharide biosynthesis/export family protein [Chitinophagaceae bacterium]
MEKYTPLKYLFFCLVLPIVLAFVFPSCYSTKRYQYFQDLTDSTHGSVPIKDYDFSLKFLPLDDININVVSAVPALAAPFNITNTTSLSGFSGNAVAASGGTAASLSNPIPNSFRVNPSGDIDYPFIGVLHVQGMTVRQLKDTLTQILRSRFLKDATVEVRLVSPSVTVMGEVAKSGRVPLSSEKTSVIDAVLAAGDFTSFSNRGDVILIREKDGQKQIHHIDLRNTDIFQSEYYYLRQNDIVFVRPNKDKGFLNDPYSRSLRNYLYMIAGVFSLYFIFRR